MVARMPGQRDGELEPTVAVAPENEIPSRHVAVLARDRPQTRHRQIKEGIDENGIGNREDPVGADRIDDRGNRDHGIGGIEVAAEQEPRDPGTKLPPAQSPFRDMAEIGRFPTRREKAENRDQREKEHEDARRDDVEMFEHGQALPTRSAAKIARAETGTSSSWNQ